MVASWVGAAGSHQVAGIDLMAADPTIERRHDPCVAEVDLSDLEVGVGLVHRGLSGVALRLPVLHLRLRGRLLLDQSLLTLVLRSRLRERCLLLLDRSLGQLDVGFIGLGLDHEQQIALLHDGAIFEVDRLEIAFDPGDQIDAVAGLRVAGQLDVVGHRPLHGLADAHGWRRRWRVGVVLAAAREQQSQRCQPGRLAGAPRRGRRLLAHARVLIGD